MHLNILITGSSGYLGQHLLSTLTSSTSSGLDPTNDYSITAAYNSLASFETTPIPTLPNIKLNRLGNIDVSNRDSLRSMITQASQFANERPIDIFVHLAALSSPAQCERDPSRATAINCPLALLDELPDSCRIIYLSSDQIYHGDPTATPFRDCDPVRHPEYYDDHPPLNVYGQTKLAFERELFRHDRFKSQSVSLRSSLMMGPPAPLGECRKQSFLQFVQQRMASGLPTTFFTDEIRSVVHVSDVVRVIRCFIQKETAAPGVYNVGGADAVSRMDIALKVAKRLGYDATTLAVPLERFGFKAEESSVAKAFPSPPDITMNMEKLRTTTGIVTMGLEKIVDKTFSAGEH